MFKKPVQISLVAVLGMYAVYGAVNSYAASNSDRSASDVNIATRAESADAHIIDVVAITQVFADGLKVSAVAIQYDGHINDASLNPSDFTVQTDVPGQRVTKAYTSVDGLQTTRRGINGSYVILELSTDYVIPPPVHKVAMTPAAGRPPMPQVPRPEPVSDPTVLNPEVVTRVGNISWDPAAHPATLKSTTHGGDGKSISINQVGDVSTTDGLTLTATTTARDNVYCRNLIVDGFMKPDFTAGSHGNVKYSIHFPSNYDSNKKYPLVVFLGDSDSPSGYKHAEYLIHGLGGVVWAGKEDEARHPAIVVVPALSRPLINENYEPTVETRPGGQSSTPYLSILDLMDGLAELIPNIDKDRVYLTGQGDGARAAFSMMTDRPHFFAAALLFAPDYAVSKAAQLSKTKLWIVASEGDNASFSSMEALVAGMNANGTHVAKARWSGQANPAQLASEVRGLSAEGNNIKYTVLKTGTVVPSGLPDDASGNHAYTWRIGYSIEPLRDWLFTQKK